MDSHQRARLQGNPSARAEQIRQTANAELLQLGARDRAVLVRCTTAAHAELPERVVDALVHDPNPMVRASLARGDASDDALMYLAADLDPIVRAAVAEREDLDPIFVYALVGDSDEKVRRTAIAHHATRIPLSPEDILWFKGPSASIDKQLGLPDRNEWPAIISDPTAPLALRMVLVLLVRPVNVLWQVGLDLDAPVELKEAVLRHPRCPASLAEDILEDYEPIQ